MINKTCYLITVALLASSMATRVGADTNEVPKPPVLPEPLADGESIEPEINIYQDDDRIIEEYRHNGQLYMIKVTPSIGKPYYLIDNDGNGSLEAKSYDLASPTVPNWILLKW